MADALTQNLNTANLLSSLGTSLFGKKSTVTTSGGGQTEQTMFSQEGINAMLRQLMENENTGYAKTALQARIPGMYNTTTQQLMLNDLLSRSAGEVATRTAPKVTTKQDTVQKTATPGMMSSSTGKLLGLGAGAAVLASPAARKKLGIDGVFNDISSSLGFGGSAVGGMSVAPAASAISGVGPGGAIFDSIQGITAGEGFSAAGAAVGAEAAGGFMSSVSSALNTPLWEGGFTGAEALPYLPAVMNLFEGDVGGAAGAGAGAYIGTAVGGPIGGAIGSFIGDAIFGGDGGCFITTAVCMNGNRADDCHELITLRNFRDTWLTRHHPEDLKQYYDEAPTIVSSISMREDAARIFNAMDRDYIQPAVAAIEAGENVIAYEIYKNLFNTAKEIANG